MNDETKLSHSDDDELTSKASARDLVRSGKWETHKKAAIELIRHRPGRTGRELFQISRETTEAPGHELFPDSAALTKRLSDLKNEERAYMGEPRSCKVTGRTAAIWYLVATQVEMF